VGFFDALWREALAAHSFWLLAMVVAALVLSRFMRARRLRLRTLGFFLSLHVALLLGTAASAASGSAFAGELRIPAWVFGSVAFVGAAAVIAFHIVLPRLRLVVSRIVEDVLVALVSIATAVTVASRAGINLSGLIATSAVVTAILGFSLQDVIGNIAGGLALQLDNSIEVGDFIKVNDVSGRVAEIRWRYTAIETGNWETVLVPNTMLMKSQVTVLGRQHGEHKLIRRVIHFNVDFRYQPSDVIDVVQRAVRDAKIKCIANDPRPSCVLLDLGDSYGRYALRYYLDDFTMDTPTDSEVRVRIFFALERAGMRLAIPAQAVFVTEEIGRAAKKGEKEARRRADLLQAVGLFAALSAGEREELAQRLKYAPFTRGEIMAREGDKADWLYLIEEGTASVWVSEGGREREVTKLSAPDFFGEMSLLTGQARLATVVAETDVECYRLDKEAFQRVLERRTEIARELAAVLSRRKLELAAAREGLDLEGARQEGERRAKVERDLFDRIRDFFELNT
jgi:small-conductance mechanosensitive channel/CRP-like cAMP-binding protein